MINTVNRTSYISFHGSDLSSENDLDSSKSNFNKIIEAMSKCGLSQSLEILNVFHCKGIDAEYAQDVLKQYNMGKVDIVKQKDTSMGMIKTKNRITR